MVVVRKTAELDEAIFDRDLADLMDSMFDAAFARFSVACKKRADVVYGKS